MPVKTAPKGDALVLAIHVDGTNIMGNPLLKASGFARVKGKVREIKVDTPITSIEAFIGAFDGLFKSEDREVK